MSTNDNTDSLPLLEQQIDEYIESYTFEGDDSNYTPNPIERLIAKDVVMGLLTEPWFVAALAAQQGAQVPQGWESLPSDLKTHLSDFEAAVCIARKHATEHDDKAYWDHQEQTLIRIRAMLSASPQSPAQPVNTNADGRTEINFNYGLSDQRIRTIIRTIKVESGYRKALVDAGFAVGLNMPRPLPALTDDMLRYCMAAMGTGSPELAGQLRTFWEIMRLSFASNGDTISRVRGGKTGWPPGLLQDDSRELARWFASRPESRYLVDQQSGSKGS